jgi:hypothetical protein
MTPRFVLEFGEVAVDQWVAGIPGKSGRKVKYGGRLLLTNPRLIWEVTRLSRKGIFAPTQNGVVNLTAREEIARATGKAMEATVNTVLGSADAAVAAFLGDRSGTAIPLFQITAVRPDETRGSVLYVDAANGSLRLLITASKWGCSKNADRMARDAAVARIRGASGTKD